MQELQVLNDKLDVLLKKYNTLLAENERLKTTVSQQHQSIQSLNTNLASLEQSMTASQLGNNLTDDKEKAAMRKQLDNVIAEIDKILTTLND
jgi:hypothetical protein